jgi:enolase-phosphatase E1
LPDVLKAEWDEPKFSKYKEAFPAEHSGSPEALKAHVEDLVVKDVKISYLKDLQGYLWQSGYESGDLKAPLFPDVAAKLRTWHEKGLRIIIYSSGSVPAQKLLFSKTDAEPGDLTPLISDWFDTVNAGFKTEASSYKTIASHHSDVPAQNWLFLSDNVKEVGAAIAAGMQSFVVQRPGNPELADDALERLQVIDSFDALDDNLGVQKQATGQKRARSPECGITHNGSETGQAVTTPSADDVPEAKKPRQDVAKEAEHNVKTSSGKAGTESASAEEEPK